MKFRWVYGSHKFMASLCVMQLSYLFSLGETSPARMKLLMHFL